MNSEISDKSVGRSSDCGQSSESLTKICSRCGKEQLTSEFHLKGRGKCGSERYHSRCKSCVSRDAAIRYKNKKRKAGELHQRRRSNRVLEVLNMDIVEFQSASDSANLTETVKEFFSMVTCRRLAP